LCRKSDGVSTSFYLWVKVESKGFVLLTDRGARALDPSAEEQIAKLMDLAEGRWKDVFADGLMLEDVMHDIQAKTRKGFTRDVKGTTNGRAPGLL
jgi:hypothetical protein